MPMAGNYMPTDANKKLYNAGSEWQDDPIAIGFGGLIDYYSTFFREYDPVIGRFNSVDPKAEITVELSIYHYSGNNPVNFNDPMGDWFTDGVGGFGANRNLGGHAMSASDWNAWDAKLSHLSWTDFESGGNGNGDMFMLSRGVITPEMVSRYFQMTWGNQASNISATTANGGFNLSFTATSSGVQYDNTVFVSTATISENIKFVFGDIQHVGPNLNRDLVEKTTIGLESAGLAYELTKSSFIGFQLLGNKMGGTNYNIQNIGKYNLIKGIRVDKAFKFLGGVNVVSSVIGIIKDKPNVDNVSSTVMGGVGLLPGPGWIISGTYFLGDLAGFNREIDNFAKDFIIKYYK